MSESWIDRHRSRLDGAVAACASREYYSAFDRSPSRSVYGEDAAVLGRKAYDAWLDGDFPLTTPGATATVVTEHSPYGFELGVAYPRVRDVRDVPALLDAATAGMHRWRTAGPE